MLETPVLSNGGDYVGEVLNRQDVYTAQAPQAFHLGDILKAHKIVRETNPDYKGIIDSCTLMKALVGKLPSFPAPGKYQGYYSGGFIYFPGHDSISGNPRRLRAKQQRNCR